MSLYKDASLVMIPSAVKDGKLYSIRPTPEYGAEQVTNGTFDTDSDWTKNSNTTISGGSATFVTGTASLYQSIGVTIGNTYKITYTIQSGSGSLNLSSSGFGGSSLSIPSVIGVNSVSVTATTTDPLYFVSLGSVNLSIDNVSVKEVLKPSGDFTFSRGSNLAATRVDVNGLIEKGRENLLLQSNQFDTTWTSSTTNASVTSGQTDPNGGSTSWLITEANDGGSIRQSVSVSGVFTFSMYLKYNSGTNQSASLFCTNNNQNATFNFSTGVPSGLNNLIDASMEDVGGGWYRCSVTLNASSSSTMILFPNNGGGIGSCFAWNAQVEQSLVATDYIPTTTTTGTAGILEDLPRLDYSGGASCPALLLEPSRTNRILQSEYFGDSLWNGGQSRDYNLTYTNELTPQGLAGSYKYESTASNNQLGAITNASTGTTITNSIYVKRVSGTGNVKLRNVNNTHTDFSLSVADGWKRIDVTGTMTSTTARLYLNLDDVGDEILIWAAQQEIGSYPTSIIPTYGSAVTRSGDDMDTNFGSALTSSGSVSVLFDFGAAYISDSNSTNNNLEFVFDNGDRIIYNQNSVSQHRIELNVNGGTEFIYKTFGILRSIPAKICVVVTNKTYKIFVNGQLTSSVGSFTGTADWTAAERFSSDINAAIGVTPIKQMLFFPTALTDSECIALTTI